MELSIRMVKTDENENFVSYVFYTRIEQGKNQTDNKQRVVVGFCSFNKKTQDCILDEKRSDKFFLERPGYFNTICAHLITLLEKQLIEFPLFTACENQNA